MNLRRLIIPLSILAMVIAVGYATRQLWLAKTPNNVAIEPAAPPDQEDSSSETIIVGDKAQKNLSLTAKQLKADIFWKTITVQGMVVDRPGISDREVVSPAVGIINRIWHAAGDIVQPGDVLFTLRLTSDPLHETQSELYKATQDIKLAQSKLERLAAAGAGIAGARLIEIESEIKRLEVAVESSRNELLNRGLSSEDVEMVADGKFVREIPVVVPKSGEQTDTVTPITYELQGLTVGTGKQVEAGETLCHLSNHQALAIEGRAFRDETLLLERSIKERWPVEVDFQESANADWRPMAQTFHIQYIANTIDPISRTFSFLIPLENQSKKVIHGQKTQLLWRFRPGQKVRLYVRVEKLENVFVLPSDAVVREVADAFLFTQNVNTFERKPIHVLYQDRDRVVIANDGSLPTYTKNNERWTIPAVVRNAAPQLNRMMKAGSSEVPKGFHIHADGSLHKNEDEGKQ
jgi:multidrug efflux pump subunit AcrA (membrane-fusion protein)